MKTKLLISISAIAAVFFAAVFVFQEHKIFSPQLSFEAPAEETLEAAPEKVLPDTPSSTLVGLIVPHFAPVASLIEDAISDVKMQPDLIILLGPNHPEAGQGKIITGKYTSKIGIPFRFDEESIEQLVSLNVATRADDIISEEHSIGVPLVLLQQQFPNTPVLPLILKYHQNPEDIEKLLVAFQKFSHKNILIVGSIDFSHYISSDLAPLRDAQTQKYIASRDYAKIQTLNNEYIDSPWTLITLLKYLEKREVRGEKVLAHTNTGKIVAEEIESSTSFLTYIFE